MGISNFDVKFSNGFFDGLDGGSSPMCISRSRRGAAGYLIEIWGSRFSTEDIRCKALDFLVENVGYPVNRLLFWRSTMDLVSL